MLIRLLIPLFTLLLVCSCSEKRSPEANTTKKSTSELKSKKNTPPEETQLTKFKQAPESSKVKVSTPEKQTKKPTSVEEIKERNNNPKSIKKTKHKAKTHKVYPVIEFEELVWDFGQITEGDVVEKKFKFKNTGKIPLSIKGTEVTCGCTRPSFPFIDIAPGESHFIGVTYNSVGKEGEQTPEITVTTNANPKIVKLKLKGVVKPKEGNSKSDSLRSNPFGN